MCTPSSQVSWHQCSMTDDPESPQSLKHTSITHALPALTLTCLHSGSELTAGGAAVVGRAGPGRGGRGQGWSCRSGRRSQQPEASQVTISGRTRKRRWGPGRRALLLAKTDPGTDPQNGPQDSPKEPHPPHGRSRNNETAEAQFRFPSSTIPGEGKRHQGQPHRGGRERGVCPKIPTSSAALAVPLLQVRALPHSGAPGHPGSGDTTRGAPACSRPIPQKRMRHGDFPVSLSLGRSLVFLQARMRRPDFPATLAAGRNHVLSKHACGIVVSQPPPRWVAATWPMGWAVPFVSLVPP